MPARAKRIVVGETTTREVWITRIIAIRITCDCWRHTNHRDGWVFLVAMDRDSNACYVKRAEDPDTAPWRDFDTNPPIGFECIGVKLCYGDENGKAEQV